MEDLQLDILNSCRICLQQDVELQSIFSVSISEVDLPKIVMSLAPILILEKDGLSEKVCEECQDEIFKAFKLQQLCIQSDKNQRDLLKLPAVEDVEMPDIFNIYKNEDVSEDVSGGSEFNDVFIFDNVETKYENDGIHFLDNISEPEEKKSFKCNQCDKVFLKQTSLLRHLNSNAHKLKNVQTLNNHSKLKEIDTQKQQAVRLKESTQSSQDVDTYQEEDADQIEFNAGLSTKKKKLRKHKCQLCDKLFEKPSKLVRHLNSSVHNIALKPFECLECHQRFATEQLLTRHGVLHSSLITPTVPVERHVCIVCSKEFPCHEAKASHLKSHKLELEQMEFQCVLCPKIFKKINDLTRHSKTHMENRQHKCNVCNKLFARGSYLIDHLNQHKGLRPHKCNICQKSFQHSYTLKNHMITHTDDRPFCCDKCGRSFNSNSNLQQHVKRHSAIKKLSCQLCPSKFAVQGDLTAHMVTHKGGKSWKCDICESSFTKSCSLREHKRIHTGLRPYECETCQKKFNSGDHLKRHLRIHTGEKPYVCKYCDRAFSQSNDLMKHTKLHVGDNIYKCEICQKGFKLQSLLRQHWKLHEGQFDNLEAGPSKAEKGEIL